MATTHTSATPRHQTTWERRAAGAAERERARIACIEAFEPSTVEGDLYRLHELTMPRLVARLRDLESALVEARFVSGHDAPTVEWLARCTPLAAAVCDHLAAAMELLEAHQQAYDALPPPTVEAHDA